MKQAALKRWTKGIAAGAAIVLVGGFLWGYFDIETGNGVLGFAVPVAVCCVAGTVAEKIAAR